MNNPQSVRLQILKDPSASLWLKRALKEMESRDPVDYLNDVELLLELLQSHYDDQMARFKPTLSKGLP